MGKRTKPPGLRSGYSQSYAYKLPAPSYITNYNHSGQVELFNAFIYTLNQVNLEAFWVHVIARGFFYQVHVFSSFNNSFFNESFICYFFTFRYLNSCFWGRLRVRYHSITSLIKRGQKKYSEKHKKQYWPVNESIKAKYRCSYVRLSLRKKTRNPRKNRFRGNRFFFRTSTLFQLGLFSLSPDILTKVVCLILRKHRRHWLVFRFMRKALRFYRARRRNFVGVQLQISGKINGRRRKNRRIVQIGPMPYQGIAHDIGYSYRIAVTKFGVFGIKLWLLKYLSDDLKLPKFILNDASQWIKALKARKTARIQRGILRKWKIMKKRLLKKRGYSRKKQKKQKIW